MPLKTQIIRSGKAIPLRWGNFHITAMVLASHFDAKQEPITGPEFVYATDERMFECYPDAPFPVTVNLAFNLSDYGVIAKSPLNGLEYVLTQRHAFRDLYDGEILKLYPGDILMAWRDFR